VFIIIFSTLGNKTCSAKLCLFLTFSATDSQNRPIYIRASTRFVFPTKLYQLQCISCESVYKSVSTTLFVWLSYAACEPFILHGSVHWTLQTMDWTRTCLDLMSTSYSLISAAGSSILDRLLIRYRSIKSHAQRRRCGGEGAIPH